MAKIDNSKKNPGQNHRLTLRDVNILLFLAEKSFATNEEVKVKFFQNRDNRNHYRRLTALRKMDYIAPLIGDNGASLGYRLSKRGVHWVRAQGYPNQLVISRPSYKTNFDHDRKLHLIEEILTASPLVSNYWPESIVRAELTKRHGRPEKRDEGYKVPDSLFNLKTMKGTYSVALELECSRKNFKQYRRFIRALSITSDADLIFVVCDNPQILLLLKTLLAEAREKDPFVRISKKDNGFYFIHTENLLRDGRNAVFEGEGKSFSLASLEKEITTLRDRE